MGDAVPGYAVRRYPASSRRIIGKEPQHRTLGFGALQVMLLPIQVNGRGAVHPFRGGAEPHGGLGGLRTGAIAR